MRIKNIRTTASGGTVTLPGQVSEVSQVVGTSLIKRGLAEETDEEITQVEVPLKKASIIGVEDKNTELSDETKQQVREAKERITKFKEEKKGLKTKEAKVNPDVKSEAEINSNTDSDVIAKAEQAKKEYEENNK